VPSDLGAMLSMFNLEHEDGVEADAALAEDDEEAEEEEDGGGDREARTSKGDWAGPKGGV